MSSYDDYHRTYRDAYDEGYDAYWEGADVSTNPYSECSEEYVSWDLGWRTAQGHDYDEKEG